MDGQFCEGTRTFGGKKKRVYIWLVTGKQWKKICQMSRPHSGNNRLPL